MQVNVRRTGGNEDAIRAEARARHPQPQRRLRHDHLREGLQPLEHPVAAGKIQGVRLAHSVSRPPQSASMRRPSPPTSMRRERLKRWQTDANAPRIAARLVEGAHPARVDGLPHQGQHGRARTPLYGLRETILWLPETLYAL